MVAAICVKRPADLCNMQVVENYWELNMSGFTCHKTPQKAISASTMCGWLKEVITDPSSLYSPHLFNLASSIHISLHG